MSTTQYIDYEVNEEDEEEISYFEETWKKLTHTIIFPSDEPEEVYRKLACLIFGLFWPFGFVGVYFLVQAENHESGSNVHTAVLLLGIALVLWGFAVSLPVLIYIMWTKTAPNVVVSFILWSTVVLVITSDLFVTFNLSPVTTLVIITAFSICSGIPSATIITLTNISYMWFYIARNAWGLDLHIPGAYDGLPGERFAMHLVAISNITAIVSLVTVMKWEQKKMLRAAQKNVVVAQAVANHVLAYETKKVTEILDIASADILIDEESGWTEPSSVSKDLVTAFRKINYNLEQWKPLLPDWAIARSKMLAEEEDEDELLMLMSGGGVGTSTRENGNDDSDDEVDMVMSERKNGNQKPSASKNNSSSSNSKNNSGSSDVNIEMTPRSDDDDEGSPKDENNKKARQYRATSSENSSSDNDNNNSNRIVVERKTRRGSGSLSPSSPANSSSLFKGAFTKHVIFCRLNFSRVVSLILQSSSSQPQQQQQQKQKQKHQTSPPSSSLVSSSSAATSSSQDSVDEISVRFNKVVEALLNTAHATSATVHSIFNDCVFMSWNATTRVVSADAKAVLFLTQFQRFLQKHFVNELIISTSNDERASRPSATTAFSSSSSSSQSSSFGSAKNLITGAAVHGSCFTQVAGNKRQQLILSSFSNKDYFEQAGKCGDNGNFVAVCKTMFQNTKDEYEYRGCGVTIAKAYRKVVQCAVFADDEEERAGNGNDVISFASKLIKNRMKKMNPTDSLKTNNTTKLSLDGIYELVGAKQKPSSPPDSTTMMMNNHNNNEVVDLLVRGEAKKAHKMIQESLSKIKRNNSDHDDNNHQHQTVSSASSTEMLSKFAVLLSSMEEQ